ncbi:auxin-responsive protein SAUR71-like [Cynara cardunculus var. scolymus]|uniref:Auxin responsive SAUR protein n=1 Tax=Cynara cardunculus var. scolymus TaxID=59895 RepID=A0A103XRT3_CYNCS|nr:auxin-responsive protein SAUR71-like [Cynara cardunculus var. scolymus]KVH95705.1 Auxin responsive SAUR protein [Cynara cardunculus var. scolymus]
MDIVKSNDKKGLILKTWERCKSFHSVGIKTKRALAKRSISLPRLDANKGKSLNIAPKGCFSVYVGPQKQRFVIRAEYANHPLFKAFLVEAECEYGYRNEGPLELPCDVNEFVKVLLEVDNRSENLNSPGCIFGNKEYQYESYPV